jgi:hypothetical protein
MYNPTNYFFPSAVPLVDFGDSVVVNSACAIHAVLLIFFGFLIIL